MIYIIHLLNSINDCVSLPICYPFRKKQPLKDIYIIILNDMGLHPTAQARDVESDQTLGLTAR